MERMMAAHAITNVSKDMAVTVVRSYFDATYYKLQPTSKFVINLQSYIRSRVQHALADLHVLTKTNVEPIVQTPLTEWTNTIQSWMVKAVESTLEDAIQASFSNGIMTSNSLCSISSNKTWELWHDPVVPLQYLKHTWAALCTKKL